MSSSIMKRHVFIHVWCVNHWREVVTELLDVISASGLSTNSHIHFGVIGTTLDAMEIVDMSGHLYASIDSFGENPEQYEFPTLEMLRAHCATNNGPVCYIHSKGVSIPRNRQHDLWRAIMADAVLWGWQTCIAALKAGHDTAGHRFLQDAETPYPHYAGNFWWATGEYIRTLPPISRLTRYEAEVWLFKNNPKAFAMNGGPLP